MARRALSLIPVYLLILAPAALAQFPWLPEWASAEAPADEQRPIDLIGDHVTIEAEETVGSVRVGRGHLEVLGRVRGTVTATESPVIVRDGGIVEGDIHSWAGPVTVARGGVIEGSVTVNAAEGRVKEGGWIAEDLSVFGSDATVEAGGQVGGKVIAIGGERSVDPAARIGGAVVGGADAGQDGADPGDLTGLALIVWLFTTIFGSALCYGLNDMGRERVEGVLRGWIGYRGRAITWAAASIGVGALLVLIPCVGWLALIPFLAALVGAAALGWATAMRLLGQRLSGGKLQSPVKAALAGFSVWTVVGIVGIFPCLLPVVLLLKWLVFFGCAGAAFMTDWGRDPEAGGCWPVKRRD